MESQSKIKILSQKETAQLHATVFAFMTMGRLGLFGDKTPFVGIIRGLVKRFLWKDTALGTEKVTQPVV